MVKGFDLVDRMPEELWTEFQNTVQEAVTKTISKKKKFAHTPSAVSAVRNLPLKKARWLSEEALQRAEQRREVKGKKDKKIYSTECKVPEKNQGEMRSPS